MVVNSTQDATDRSTLKEAIFSGLPYNGGLFQPFPHPNLKSRIKNNTQTLLLNVLLMRRSIQ